MEIKYLISLGQLKKNVIMNTERKSASKQNKAETGEIRTKSLQLLR